VRERAIYQEIGIDTAGYIRLAFMRMAIDPGVCYSSNRSGTWSRLELMD
jgi:hypothetical protein